MGAKKKGGKKGKGKKGKKEEVKQEETGVQTLLCIDITVWGRSVKVARAHRKSCLPPTYRGAPAMYSRLLPSSKKVERVCTSRRRSECVKTAISHRGIEGFPENVVCGGCCTS